MLVTLIIRGWTAGALAIEEHLVVDDAALDPGWLLERILAFNTRLPDDDYCVEVELPGSSPPCRYRMSSNGEDGEACG